MRDPIRPSPPSMVSQLSTVFAAGAAGAIVLALIAKFLMAPAPPPLGPAGESVELRLSWNETEREGGSVVIDRKPHYLPPFGEVVYSLEPGRHRVVLKRPGYQPIQFDWPPRKGRAAPSLKWTRGTSKESA